MSVIGSNILAGAAGSGVSAYEIEQSLRFDGSSYLTWTPSSTGDQQTFTQSVWFKRAGLTTNDFLLFNQNDPANVSTYFLQIQKDPAMFITCVWDYG